VTNKLLHTPPDLDLFAREHPRIDHGLSRRVSADPENVERGLANLVLTIVELLRQLMERQALRRIDTGTLSEDQVERLGRTFMELDKRMAELRDEFGLDEEDLNLDLGPLGPLLPRDRRE
jgi:Gas vesicle protein K